MFGMRRREFMTLLGGAAAAWPLAARAQQPERVRRVGVLMNLAADDPEGLTRFGVFVQELQQLGWNEGRNMRIDHRWAGGSANMHWSWWHSRRMSSSPLAFRVWRRSTPSLTPCRSCSCWSLIRSALALSKAWFGRAAMSPASPCTNSA